MAATALLIGRAVQINDGYFNVTALWLITAAIAVCAIATLFPPIEALESMPPQVPVVLLALAVVAETVMLVRGTAMASSGIACVGLLALMQAFDLGRLRVPLATLTVVVFSFVASVVFWRTLKSPPIDVFVFQQTGAANLLDAINPYLPGYPNLYRPDQVFYGPGVVDANNRLTVGLPYPPLSLLISMPAYLLGGDIRYADVAAVAVAAWLMVVWRPNRWTALAAMLFLLTPRVLFVIELAWSETLLVLMFSLVMVCALRRRAALPYALGLFIGVKQSAVLALPFVTFLLAPADSWTNIARVVGKALLLAVIVTLPFFLWNPAAFWRSVVEFQFIQPMRSDALSHLVWMRERLPQPLVALTPFVLLVVTTALVLWRCPRTPAHFAAATTLVWLVFVAFNKQAFCNYYYYAIGTASWAAVAASVDGDRREVTDK